MEEERGRESEAWQMDESLVGSERRVNMQEKIKNAEMERDRQRAKAIETKIEGTKTERRREGKEKLSKL